jgi:hypothetical protein
VSDGCCDGSIRTWGIEVTRVGELCNVVNERFGEAARRDAGAPEDAGATMSALTMHNATK